MAGTNGPWWQFPQSDSPLHIQQQDAERPHWQDMEDRADDQRKNPGAVVAYAVLILIFAAVFALACRAWAQEDDLTAARIKAYQQRLHEAPVARVDR